MTHVIHSDGSVTYSTGVDAVIKVRPESSNLYTIEGGSRDYVIEAGDVAQAATLRRRAAEMIAVAAAFDRHEEQRAAAAVDCLAEALYTAESADADGPPPAWADAFPATRRRFENKAATLRALGVTAGV